MHSKGYWGRPKHVSITLAWDCQCTVDFSNNTHSLALSLEKKREITDKLGQSQFYNSAITRLTAVSAKNYINGTADKVGITEDGEQPRIQTAMSTFIITSHAFATKGALLIYSPHQRLQLNSWQGFLQFLYPHISSSFLCGFKSQTVHIRPELRASGFKWEDSPPLPNTSNGVYMDTGG